MNTRAHWRTWSQTITTPCEINCEMKQSILFSACKQLWSLMLMGVCRYGSFFSTETQNQQPNGNTGLCAQLESKDIFYPVLTAHLRVHKKKYILSKCSFLCLSINNIEKIYRKKVLIALHTDCLMSLFLKIYLTWASALKNSSENSHSSFPLAFMLQSSIISDIYSSVWVCEVGHNLSGPMWGYHQNHTHTHIKRDIHRTLE